MSQNILDITFFSAATFGENFYTVVIIRQVASRKHQGKITSKFRELGSHKHGRGCGQTKFNHGDFLGDEYLCQSSSQGGAGYAAIPTDTHH